MLHEVVVHLLLVLIKTRGIWLTRAITVREKLLWLTKVIIIRLSKLLLMMTERLLAIRKSALLLVVHRTRLATLISIGKRVLALSVQIDVGSALNVGSVGTSAHEASVLGFLRGLSHAWSKLEILLVKGLVGHTSMSERVIVVFCLGRLLLAHRHHFELIN